MNPGATLDWPSAIRIAAMAGADPKTVIRVFTGKPTRPSVRTRIMKAMLDCGAVPPAPLEGLPASSSEALHAAPGEHETP